MPRRRRKAVPVSAVVVLILLAVALSVYERIKDKLGPASSPQHASFASDADYLFCFWNVENLFDDQDDNRPRDDEEFDDWFARDGAMLQKKLDRLTEALLRLNDGKGPDILALAEVEGVRAADLLRQALNKQLRDESLHYRFLLMKELTAGRHIAPAILTRLPVRGDKTQLLGRQLRILEGHIQVNGHDLVIINSHWTSRRSDETGERRAKYGDQIYGAFKAMYRSNPRVDLLVCGDCNDPPDAASITQHLHAVGDLEAVRQAQAEPLLFNLFAGKDARQGWGTFHYSGKWFIYDQLFVAPGLLDQDGWSCLPNTVQVVNTLYRSDDKARRPWRFGGEKECNERGYSDHFPVTVRLKVQPAGQ